MGFGHPGLGQAQRGAMLVGVGLVRLCEERAGLLPQRACLGEVLGGDGLGLGDQVVAGLEKGSVISGHGARE